jgi:hypothetical protein
MAMSERKKPIPIIKLSHRVIERTLDALGIPHCRDDDGDIFTVIPSGDSRSDLLCWFLVDRNILQLVCTFNAKIPQCDWMAALLLCNAYHRESRFAGLFCISVTDRRKQRLALRQRLIVQAAFMRLSYKHISSLMWPRPVGSTQWFRRNLPVLKAI